MSVYVSVEYMHYNIDGLYLCMTVWQAFACRLYLQKDHKTGCYSMVDMSNGKAVAQFALVHLANSELYVYCI